MSSVQAVYFTAPWCVPCRTFGPVMDSVTSVSVRKLDVDKFPQIAALWGVMSVPTVILFDNNREVGRFSGARSKDYVEKFIASHHQEKSNGSNG